MKKFKKSQALFPIPPPPKQLKNETEIGERK
jgi:hypothetical protein